jgi:hypothetical protein
VANERVDPGLFYPRAQITEDSCLRSIAHPTHTNQLTGRAIIVNGSVKLNA